MRRLAFFSSAMLIFLGGCVLTGNYGYDDYKDGKGGSSSATSSAGGGDASSSGSGGLGGMGGMGGNALCPPDLCDDKVVVDCRMTDCTVSASLQRFYGNGGHQAIKAMAAPGNGNIVFGGNYTGTVNFGNGVTVSDATGGIYPFVAMVDADGTSVVAYARTEKGAVYSVESDATGDALYATGLIEGQASPDQRHVFVQKFGLKPWEHQIGNDPSNESAGIARGGESQIFAAGHFKGFVSPPAGSGVAPFTAPASDSLIMQFIETSGVCTWATKIQNSYATSIDATASRVAVGGFYSGLIDLPGGIMSDETASFFAVYDIITHTLLAKNFLVPTSGNVNLVNIVFDPVDSQSLYIAAKFKGVLNIGKEMLTSTGGGSDQDLLVAKFNSAGDVTWARRFGGGGEQIPFSITPYKDGIFISGTTAQNMAIESDMNTGPLCPISKCMFLLKLSPMTGKPIWGRAFGQMEMASDPTAVSAADTKNFWLGGGWSTKIAFTSMETAPAGGQDLVLGKFDSFP